MTRFLLLDSGPLGLLTQPHRSSEVLAINLWLTRCLRADTAVLVPAIVYYEIRRELLRAQRTFGLARLDAFVEADPYRYLTLTDSALRLAAELWAESRRQGRPTADSAELDVDMILAAQALSLNVDHSELVIATTNTRHLSLFVKAQLWNEIASE